ncbi:GGDEF domain-containing protein [Luteimonas kalidii]|uniref:diguanylate cyclase n=1 Tax=Luteimonas kalidii TaxID=3042025 RepID=A0ABT6JS94_9GAMM|nr:GGDEF domain-containing protein [Luteimonas kalidii]MDH5833474.1 GGDEF domain-containing protein [Luteimonas kalidii]
MWKHRLRVDFHLGIVVMFGAITVLGIAPFGIYRHLTGEWLIALIDLVIVASIVGAVLYAWRTGRTAGVASFLAATYSLGCVAVAHLAGLPGLLWVYPVLVANFLLVRRWPALLISAAAAAAVMASDAALATPVEKILFMVTAIVVSLFSFVFASRAELQRSQLEAIALRDPLTGAGNRRGLELELHAAIVTSQRQATPLGMLIFDIDHFKAINDDFGHEAGDDVLVQLATVVRGSTRANDRFFRLGGEEFTLLLPGASGAALWAIAEKLRSAVETDVQCRGRTVTISIGAASHQGGESAAEWLARADAAMYRAKRGGRNRTMTADDGDGPS